MKDHFSMFAAYNRWANGRVYVAAAELTEDELAADRGAFFKSVIGTLNHLLVTDRIWMRRMSGDGPTYPRLDLILHERLADLRAAREAEDARLIAWVDDLTAAELGGEITYTPISEPILMKQALAPVLAHLFNHQTHHRGQTHALLTGFGREAPALDLMHFQRERGIGLTA